MRPALLACLLAPALAGCGKTPGGNPDPTSPSSRAPDVGAPQGGAGGPPDFEGRAIDVINAYQENPVAADAKYLGKRVRLSGPVCKIGRTRDGRAFLGVEGVASFRREVEPSMLLLFGKSEEGSFEGVRPRSNQVVTVEGVCRGRTDDGIDRDVRGYEFHVRVEGCRIVKLAEWKDESKK